MSNIPQSPTRQARRNPLEFGSPARALVSATTSADGVDQVDAMAISFTQGVGPHPSAPSDTPSSSTSYAALRPSAAAVHADATGKGATQQTRYAPLHASRVYSEVSDNDDEAGGAGAAGTYAVAGPPRAPPKSKSASVSSPTPQHSGPIALPGSSQCVDMSYVYLRRDGGCCAWLLPNFCLSCCFRKAKLTNAVLFLDPRAAGEDGEEESEAAGKGKKKKGKKGGKKHKGGGKGASAEAAGASASAAAASLSSSTGALGASPLAEDVGDEDEEDAGSEDDEDADEGGGGRKRRRGAADDEDEDEGDSEAEDDDVDEDVDDDEDTDAQRASSSSLAGTTADYGSLDESGKGGKGGKKTGKKGKKDKKGNGGANGKKGGKGGNGGKKGKGAGKKKEKKGKDQLRVFKLVFMCSITALAGVFNNLMFVKMGLAMPGYPAFLLYFTTLLYVIIYWGWLYLRRDKQQQVVAAAQQELAALPNPDDPADAGRLEWESGGALRALARQRRKLAKAAQPAPSLWSSLMNRGVDKGASGHADGANKGDVAGKGDVVVSGVEGDLECGKGAGQGKGSPPSALLGSINGSSCASTSSSFSSSSASEKQPLLLAAPSSNGDAAGATSPSTTSPSPKRYALWQVYLFVGALITFGGTCSQFSDPHVTGSLQAVINQLTLPLTALCAWRILKHRFTLVEIVGAGIVFAGSLLPLIPVMWSLLVGSHDGIPAVGSGSVNSPFWVFVFLLSDVPSALVNVVEEIAFSAYRVDEIHYLAFTNLITLFGYTATIPLDKINPGQDAALASLSNWQIQDYAFKCFFGQEVSYTVPVFSGVQSATSSMLLAAVTAARGVSPPETEWMTVTGLPPACSPAAWMPVLGFVLCIVVYFYVSAVVVKHESAAFQALAGTLVTPLSAVAFSSVALMGSHAQPLDGLIVLAIVIVPMGIFIYKWEDVMGEGEDREDIIPLIARH